MRHPAVPEVRVQALVRPLLRGDVEVENPGEGQLLLRVAHPLLPDQVHLPVPPLHGVEVGAEEHREPFAGRGLLLAQQKGRLVHAVNSPVGGNFNAAHPGQRAVHVHDMHDFVAHPAGRDLARPADEKGHAQGRFHGGRVGTRPRAGPTAPRIRVLRTVVAGEHEDGVVLDLQSGDGVEDLPHTPVHLRRARRPNRRCRFCRQIAWTAPWARAPG